MAELATGSVSTLLSVISNEARRLGRVQGDVQFIQEEMESMSSFLANLSRTRGEHDDQVRTWMNQVRILANDCNNCIDLYLQRGKPDFHLARKGPLGYLGWAPSLLRELLAQHRAAGQLRELKERARAIGDRRLRYAVDVKKEPSPGVGAGLTAPPSLLAATQDHEEDEDEEEDHDGSDPLKMALSMTTMSMDKEDVFKRRLDQWIGPVVKATEEDIKSRTAGSKPLPSIAFVVPETKNAGARALEAQAVVKAHCKPAEEAQAGAQAHFKPAEEAQALADAVPPETKDTGALANEAPAVHEDQSVPKTQINWNVVLLDIPAVHYDLNPLRPQEILCYILRKLEFTGAKEKWGFDMHRRMTIRKIKGDIEEMKVDGKIKKIKTSICQVKGQQQLDYLEKLTEGKNQNEEFGEKLLEELLWLFIWPTTAAAQKDQENVAIAAFHDSIINQTAKKLKREIEVDADRSKDALEYEDILRKVFQKPTTPGATLLMDGQIKEMIDGVKEIAKAISQSTNEMLQELREIAKADKSQETGEPAQTQELRELDKSDKTRETTEPAQTQELQEIDKAGKNREAGSPDQTQEAIFLKETTKKMDEIQIKIKELLKIKGIERKIHNFLGDDGRILIILNTDGKYVSKWEETRKTLSLLGCTSIAGAVIVATEITQQNMEKITQHDMEDPQPNVIEYSLVGLYLDTVLKYAGQHVHEDSQRHILRNILYECKSHEFCMKIFAHAMCAKPKRSSEELTKLQSTLQATQKSLPSMARKMLKFSYRDLPKDYRSCLLYLAIFPRGHKIKRSTLIGRWVAEGLITTKDWSWSSSVDEAEKCFDTLIARCLVCPAGIGAAGRVKTCTMDKLVYGFITKIAMKQRILETRLSHHLARHFSIFSDVRLRSSENIEHFLENIPKSSQFSKLKVLDLEGCRCFEKNKHYLRDICSKILMLKYLSLRRTDVTRLPSEINNLHELEVLDIRQTKIPAHATRNVLLLKLKRLLAGHIDSSTTKSSSVQIPEKIEKMVGVEILSNVKPHNSRDLKDIGSLNKLKKLGVVINESDLQPLLNAVSDLLKQSLRFVSITLGETIDKGTPPALQLKNDPKDLESLCINASTFNKRQVELLKVLVKNGKQLAKVTLSGTLLKQEDLKVLAELPKLRCVRLGHMAYTDSKLIFNKGEFKNLNSFLFLVEKSGFKSPAKGLSATLSEPAIAGELRLSPDITGAVVKGAINGGAPQSAISGDCETLEETNMTEIRFDNGAASDLEKIVLSSNIKSISGVDCLQKLEELELNNIKNKIMLSSLFDNAKHIAKVTLRDTLLEQSDLLILAKKPKMRCLVLLGSSYNDSHLIFNKDEFPKLNLLIVDSSVITEISFTGGSPNLEKIVWSFTQMDSLSGIDKVPRLKEIELNGAIVPDKVEEDIRQKSRINYIVHSKPESQDQATENKREADGVARCPSFWKAKGWRRRN